MEARIKKWGNSLAVRIPQTMAEDIGLAEDCVVDLLVRAGKLVIGTKKKKYLLSDLLTKIDKDNLHQATEWGSAVGSEVW